MPVWLVVLIFMSRIYRLSGFRYCEYFYPSVVVVVLCCMVFLLIKEVKMKDSRLIRELSTLFLPVFTLHTPVLHVLQSQWSDIGQGAWGGILCWLTVLSITVVLSWIIMKIRFVRWVFRI